MPQRAATSPKPAAVDQQTIAKIKAELIQVSSLAPQTRGYAFETFLKRLFDAFGLAAQEPFRLRGEQIDGSFQLASEIYLLEAKWQGQQIGVAELHTFHGKIEQKAAWTRGLFVSNSGFTEDGLAAFGRGKRVICLDGFDLYEMLDREIPLTRFSNARCDAPPKPARLSSASAISFLNDWEVRGWRSLMTGVWRSMPP